jgi:hypothetical protein
MRTEINIWQCDGEREYPEGTWCASVVIDGDLIIEGGWESREDAEAWIRDRVREGKFKDFDYPE